MQPTNECPLETSVLSFLSQIHNIDWNKEGGDYLSAIVVRTVTLHLCLIEEMGT